MTRAAASGQVVLRDVGWAVTGDKAAEVRGSIAHGAGSHAGRFLEFPEAPF